MMGLAIMGGLTKTGGAKVIDQSKANDRQASLERDKVGEKHPPSASLDSSRCVLYLMPTADGQAAVLAARAYGEDGVRSRCRMRSVSSVTGF